MYKISASGTLTERGDAYKIKLHRQILICTLNESWKSKGKNENNNRKVEGILKSKCEGTFWRELWRSISIRNLKNTSTSKFKRPLKFKIDE